MTPDQLSHLPPLNVLADRSRDAQAGVQLLRMLPAIVFRVTASRVRLNARLLKAYDVLAICGNGTDPYSRTELRAIRSFVERGGTLILASAAGEFERATGLDASRLGTNGPARLFGFEFESAAGLPHHSFGPRAIPVLRLRTTKAARRLGLPSRMSQLMYPAPLAVPPGSTVLLEKKKTGTPVAASARVGRGVVLAWADLGLWDSWASIYAAVLVAAMAPSRRVAGDRPPSIIEQPARRQTRGRFRFEFAEETQSQIGRVRAIATRVLDDMAAACRPKKLPDRVTMHLVPGTRVIWRPAPEGESHLSVGAGLSDAGLVYGLVRGFVGTLLSRLPGHHAAVLRTIDHALSLRLLDRYGHAAEAAEIRASVLGGPRIDLGRRYQETPVARPARRLLDEAEVRFGEGTIDRFLAAMPEKGCYDEFNPRLFSRFDITAFYLARAVGESAYDWLQENGHTVRRIPLAPPGSKELSKAIDRWARSLLLNSEADLSDRFDALLHIARDEGKRPRGLPRRAAGRDPARALPAAFTLALRRDDRARSALGRWMRRGGPGIGAVAALILVSELADRSAADALASAAEGADPRFRLMASKALRRIGDPRAEEHTFEKLPGSRIRRTTERVHPQVDGVDVAVTGGSLRSYAHGGGFAAPQFYVWWVHTDPRWRGLGLARIAFRARLDSPDAKAAATHCLHADVDYVAYTLYRDEGFFDYRREKILARASLDAPARSAPRGVRISAEKPGEAVEVCRFLDELHRLRPEPPFWQFEFPSEIVFVARREGEVVGAVRATHIKANCNIVAFGVAVFDEDVDGKRRTAVGLALLSALEREAAKRGGKEVVARMNYFPWDRAHWDLLARAGYGQRPGPHVEQVRVANLRFYLSCLEGLFEARLAAAPALVGWRGTIVLDGGRLRGGLEVRAGRVRVLSRVPGRPSVRLSGTEEAITRVAIGSASSFELWQKGDLAVRPKMGRDTRLLLDALFPRVAEPTG